MENRKPTPLITVILPTYNRTNYLGAAIESILNQTYAHFELLILDDGSTDNTAEVVQQYQDDRINYIKFPKNRGVPIVRNDGLAIAKGEFIAFMDSDDISHKERFSEQVKVLVKDPTIAVCGTDLQFFGDKNTLWNLKGGLHIKIRALFDMPTHFPCAMVRKSVLDQYDIRFESVYLPSEDYLFLLRIITKEKGYIIPQPLYLYRWHAKNISVEMKQESTQHAEEVSALAFKAILNISLPKAEHHFLYHLYHWRIELPELWKGEQVIESLLTKIAAQNKQDLVYQKGLRNLLYNRLFENYIIKSSEGFTTFITFLKSKIWLKLPFQEYGFLISKFFIKSLLGR